LRLFIFDKQKVDLDQIKKIKVFLWSTDHLRPVAVGLLSGCIVAGVTEPAIYGVNLPLKKPMIGVVAGAAAVTFVLEFDESEINR